MSNPKSKFPLSRRHILLFPVAFPLAGCGGLKPYGISLGDWGNLIGAASGFGTIPGISRQQAAQIPFATIGFRIGNSAEGLLILAEKSQSGAMWTSVNRQAIVTAKGRVLQTAGFHWNLSGTNFVEDDPVGTPRLMTNLSGSFERICVFADISRFQVPVRSEFKVDGLETITILDTDLKTVRVVENCHSEALNWSFQNCYWIDGDSGFVWRTTQTVHPNEDPVTIEILRPEA